MSPDQRSEAAGAGERELQNMLLRVVRALVDHPDDAEVELFSDEEGAVFEIRANPTDVGRLIGKNGQTVRALRVIVNASGVKNGKRFEVEIDRPDGDSGRR